MEELRIERNSAAVLHLQMDRPHVMSRHNRYPMGSPDGSYRRFTVLPGWCISLGRLLNECLQALMLGRVHISKKGNLKGPHGACPVDILLHIN